MSPRFLACVVVGMALGLATGARVQAQSSHLSAAARSVNAADESAWRKLEGLRLAQRDEKRREGFWLLSWGLANTIGGAAAAGAQRDSDSWLGASITTLSFGAINAALALGLLDLSGRHERAILNEPRGSTADLGHVRDRERAAQLKSGQIFALNAGLDVAYLVAGALLFAIAQKSHKHADWERGAAVAMLGQGTFLLGFDSACWLRSNRRAQQLRASP